MMEIERDFRQREITSSHEVQFLHVANGTRTTDIIKAAGIPGIRSIWSDPLYEGPVPALPDEQLIDIRTRYLLGPSTDILIHADNDMRRWRALIAAHDNYEELVLWFEHDLFDQLNLVQLLSWIRGRLPAGKLVSLICIGSFPGHPSFKGIAQLSPIELASVFAMRREVNSMEYSLAERTWKSFQDPTPEALDNLRHEDTTALPFIASALGRFLQEYPWTTDGLSRTERHLLKLAHEEPIELKAAFPRMHEGEDVYYITDSSFMALTEVLSRTTPPLLTINGDDNSHASSFSKRMRLAEAGKEVLSGVRDRVSCGIDRWLGGVHLYPGSDDWRWDEERQRTIKVPEPRRLRP